LKKKIHSGIEISKKLAQDAMLQEWFKSNGKSEKLEHRMQQNLTFIAEDLGYPIAFIANITTLNFRTNGNKPTEVLSENDPDDAWFFNFLNKKKSVEINIDFNNDLKETFVWVNALIGSPDKPLGVAGIGLPFQETFNDFTKNEFEEFGKVWMINGKGQIQIDEQVENLGRQVQDFIPAPVFTNFLANPQKNSVQICDDPDKPETIFDWRQEVVFAMSRIADTDSVIVIRIYKTRWLWHILKPFFRGVLRSAMITLVLVSSIFALISILTTKVLTRLSQKVIALGEEDFESPLCQKDTDRKDEFGEIARGLETTGRKLSNAYYALKERENRLKSLNKTFERFVPRQFLNRIAKDGLEQIHLGNAESDIITILFSDIRSFTSLSENMAPQEILNFLNEYFQQMNRPIHDNHGFIDKFIGDAIMALFARTDNQEDANDAVLAAVEMQENLAEYNRHRKKSGYIPISIGVGVHTGPVVIGTVGSSDRMESTVLGDSVNLASRLEGLTKRYNSQIIISSQTYRHLASSDFLCRELDFVSVKGRDKPVVIFEVFNSDPANIRDLKQEMLFSYHKGLGNYYLKNWQEAIQLFKSCVAIYPDDVVSKMYIERCGQFQKAPPSDNSLSFKASEGIMPSHLNL